MDRILSSLIPMPKEIKRSGNFFSFDSLLLPNDSRLDVFQLLIKQSGKKQLPLYLIDIQKLSKGFYELSISEDRILLSYSDEEGLYNALGTLYQIVMLSDGEMEECVIYDGPRFEYRGFMLDCVRNFFNVSYIKKLIDAAFVYHLNVFHWHLTDDQGWRIELLSHPELTEEIKDGFYSQDEIREVIEYAHNLGIEIIPEIECPGHVSALLASRPDLGCTGGPYSIATSSGVFVDVLCLGNEEVFEFLDDVIGEVATLFKSKYMHIGGDECPTVRWEKCPKCKAKMEKVGIADSHKWQWYFTKRITDIVRKYGKIPMGWDEIANPMSTHPIDSDITVLLWRGEDSASSILKNGNKMVICRLDDGAYLDYKQVDTPDEPGWLGVNTLDMSYNMEMCYQELEGHENIIGGQGNLWTEKINNTLTASYMMFPRLIALAENFWRYDKDIASFKERLKDAFKILELLNLSVGYRLK